MAEKEKFVRGKTHLNIGTIGHVDMVKQRCQRQFCMFCI